MLPTEFGLGGVSTDLTKFEIWGVVVPGKTSLLVPARWQCLTCCHWRWFVSRVSFRRIVSLRRLGHFPKSSLVLGSHSSFLKSL